MAATRQLMTPVNLNLTAFAGNVAIGAVAPGAGCDYAAAGGSTFTAWASLPNPSSLGIMYYNTGSQWLWGYNGATPASAYVLIGQKAGGLAVSYLEYTVALPTSGYFYLGAFSPSQFNQQDISQFAGGGGGTAPGGVIGAAGQGLTCIDFSVTTTVAVRLYQSTDVTP